MWRQGMHHERGQASVELVAVLPLIALLVLCAVQVAAALNAWSAAHEAARAGARAELVGAAAHEAARRALVGAPARGLDVRASTGADGTHRVRVRTAMPRLMPWVAVPTVASAATAGP